MNKQPVNSAGGEKKPTQQLRVATLLDNNRARFAISLVLALFAWMYVTMVIQTNTVQTITNIPVDFSYGSVSYTQQGLSIVNQPEYTVSVVASGDGYLIGNLSKDDFIVYPDYSSVKGSGEMKLRLNVRCTASGSNAIDVSLKKENSTVNVIFDTVGDLKLPITVATRNVTIEEGYILNRAVALPGEVNLTGPVGELEKIKTVVAEFDVDGKLQGNTQVRVPLKYLDEEGHEVPFTYTTSDVNEAEVSLTVYKLAEMPISISFVNKPLGFDESVLKYTLSQESLRVAGPADVVDRLGEMAVGTIDLSTFALDKVYELPVTLPNGIVSQENLKRINVSFDCSGLSTKTLNLPADTAVEVINLPSGYTIAVESERIHNVELYGPPDVLEGLTAQSVVARIDIDDLSLVVGQQNIAVSIYVPSAPQVFAVGTYTVQCKIESNG